MYPDLYVFIPDDNGDYVHIIRKENVEAVDVKWYEFWLNETNENKIYREFKDGSDEVNGIAPHYFKRYNSRMDYDFQEIDWSKQQYTAKRVKY
jgi:RPA family protein